METKSLQPPSLTEGHIVTCGAVSVWTFVLAYVGLDAVLPAVQEQLAMSQLPYAEREHVLQVCISPSHTSPVTHWLPLMLGVLLLAAPPGDRSKAEPPCTFDAHLCIEGVSFHTGCSAGASAGGDL